MLHQAVRFKFPERWWKTYGWLELAGWRIGIFRTTYFTKDGFNFPPFVIKILKPNTL